MNTVNEAWLKERRTGIGGSDAAAVLGLSKWKTPLEVWQEKRGDVGPQLDNEPMLWGRALEPVIRQQYAERTGRIVRVPETIIRHPSIEFMLANLDGFTDDRRIVEIKTARSGNDWGEPGTDEVPPAYLIQVQHYLAVTGFDVADIAVLIGGSDFRLYEVPADPELQDMIVKGEAEFWHLVCEGIPPEPVSYADAQARFGHASREGSVVASAEVLQAVERLRLVKEQAKALEAEEESLKATVMIALGENDTLIHGGKSLVTWKAAKPSMRFDTTAFKEAHPDLYAGFTKAGEVSRRFLIK